MVPLLVTGAAEIEHHLPIILSYADANRRSLGFLPASVFREQASRGRLWAAIDKSTNAVLGYLLWGGRYPDLRIVQLFVNPETRTRGIGSLLINQLVNHGQRYGFSAITARVAEDLEANEFWERKGFRQLRQKPGGSTTRRTINVRVRYLDVPLLFSLSQPHGIIRDSLRYEQLPTLPPAIYALDLNAVIDIIRQRSAKDAVSALLRAAFNNLIQLVITEEASVEVTRSSSASGIDLFLLRFLQELPRLPAVGENTSAAPHEELRRLVYPDRLPTRSKAAQDRSDLIHLSTCIHHGITGFVTSDQALLRSASRISERYGLEVLSPGTFLRAELPGGVEQSDLRATVETDELCISAFTEAELEEVVEFAADHFTDNERRLAWRPGVQGAERARICARVNGQLAGVAAWDLPSHLNLETNLYILLDESSSSATRFVDHVLAAITRPPKLRRSYRILLHHGAGETTARSTALSRGFHSLPGFSANHGLVKVATPRPVRHDDWPSFRKHFLELTSIELPEQIPSYRDVTDHGLDIREPRSGKHYRIGPFEFETAISPGMILFPGRECLIIPIRQTYADDLLGTTRSQLRFLPEAEAILRLERAYFRSSRGAQLCRKGMPAIFYISGSKGGMRAAVACARISSSAILAAADAVLRYRRQGVLTEKAIGQTAGHGGLVHVITFDSVIQFDRAVSFTTLKKLGCVSGANLITLQRIDSSGFDAVVSEAFDEQLERR